MNNSKILYVEDDDKQRQIITKLLKRNNFVVIDVKNPIEGLDIIKNEYIDIIVSDYRMPEMNGDKFFEEVKKINPYISFILVTAYGNIDLAVNTMKSGAVDFLTKPFDFDILLEKVKSISKKRQTHKEIEKIEKLSSNKAVSNFEGVIGKSKSFTELLAKIPRISITDMPVLITGESGTGKELIADLIHKLSKRKNENFIKINCAAIPENLMESELFGYEKGAFTGAVKSKKGLIESADKGTIFLDEVGEFNYTVQSKLLRFLQNSEINKIGSSTTKKVDVRVISATNRDLKHEVKNKTFREDLYFRLNVIHLTLPPLRKRKEDIPLLVDFFINKYTKEDGLEKKVINSKTMDKLIKYDYPGNIRELENIIRNSMVLSMGNEIEAEDIPVFNVNDYEEELSIYLPEKPIDINEYISTIEKRIIEKALEKHNWSRVKTAEYLNVTERVLRYKIDKFNLKNK